MSDQENHSEPKPIPNNINQEHQKSLWQRIGGWIGSRGMRQPAPTGERDANQLAEIRTDLASTRTLMAADRTLMAWVRTALSMISFGFTIYKVLQGFSHSAQQQVVKASPEDVGLFLIGLGTISMTMGTIEYWYNLKEMRQLQSFRILRPAFVMALIISVTGLATFVSVMMKVL